MMPRFPYTHLRKERWPSLIKIAPVWAVGWKWVQTERARFPLAAVKLMSAAWAERTGETGEQEAPLTPQDQEQPGVLPLGKPLEQIDAGVPWFTLYVEYIACWGWPKYGYRLGAVISSCKCCLYPSLKATLPDWENTLNWKVLFACQVFNSHRSTVYKSRLYNLVILFRLFIELSNNMMINI